MSAKAPAKGTSAKHATTSKASASSTASKKHAPTAAKKPATAQAKGAKVTTAAKPAKPAKPAGFAIGDLLPVCASEALAMSLRLAGGAVSDEDVLRLHVLAAGSENAPASILAVLEAASAFGLAGYVPGFSVCSPWPADHRNLGGGFGAFASAATAAVVATPGDLALILGVTRPGYHAVLATPDGWWSWGKLYSPWNARAEEAWGVSWG